jgi:hypothetical protein
MKRGSLIIDFGWFGFGAYRGLFPGVCLGPVKLMWLHGTVEAKLQEYRDALQAARDALARLMNDGGPSGP